MGYCLHTEQQNKNRQNSPFELNGTYIAGNYYKYSIGDLIFTYRKAVLPIENEHTVSDSECVDVSNLDGYMKQWNDPKDELFTEAKENIKTVQFRMKKDHDRKTAE